jgi:hypothetical protein
MRIIVNPTRTHKALLLVRLLHHDRIICHPAIKNDSTAILRFPELALVLVRLDHVARFIVNATSEAVGQ